MQKDFTSGVLGNAECEAAVQEVVKVIKKVEEALGEDGRILVRESGTEPVVRVMVEARSHEICREKVDKVVKVLREKGHVIK
jgi:phosphoglucosamine mutase